MTERKIKIWIEVPEKFLFDVDQTNLQSFFEIQRGLQEMVFDQALEKVMKEIKIPNITIDPEELKKAVQKQMVEQVIDKYLNDL